MWVIIYTNFIITRYIINCERLKCDPNKSTFFSPLFIAHYMTSWGKTCLNNRNDNLNPHMSTSTTLNGQVLHPPPPPPMINGMGMGLIFFPAPAPHLSNLKFMIFFIVLLNLYSYVLIFIFLLHIFSCIAMFELFFISYWLNCCIVMLWKFFVMLELCFFKCFISFNLKH